MDGVTESRAKRPHLICYTFKFWSSVLGRHVLARPKPESLAWHRHGDSGSLPGRAAERSRLQVQVAAREPPAHFK